MGREHLKDLTDDDRIVYAIGMLAGLERRLHVFTRLAVWAFGILAGLILVTARC